MRKLWIILLLGIALFILNNDLSSATIMNFTTPVPINITANTANAGTESGWKLLPSIDLLIYSVYINQTAGAVANRAFIRNQSGAVIANVSITNFKANFAGVSLSTGMNYSITVTNTSGTWNVSRSTSFSTFPYFNESFNITRVIDNVGSELSGSQNWWIISKMEFDTVPFISVTLHTPADNSMQNNNLLKTFNFSLTPIGGGNITNYTLIIWNSTGSIINQSFSKALSGNTTNSTLANLSIDSSAINSVYTWNVFGCGNISTGTSCRFAVSNFTFTLSPIVNSNTYNATTYETASEPFITNITTSGLTSASLIWNNVSYSGTITSSGANQILSRTISDIPLNIFSNVSWYWSLIYSDGGQANTTSSGQVVNPINLTSCSGSPLNVPYINFTFKNETTSLNAINASISSSIFSYWLGTGTVTKTLSYSNVTENPSFAFCFSPADRTVSANATISYANSESPQRTAVFSSLSLSNASQNSTLYLLPSSVGTYTRYRTVNVAGSIITGVLGRVSRTISGTSTLIVSGYTDDSGQISFFLNPDLSYDYVFSKTGFSSAVFSLIPNSLETYTVTLGGSSSVLSSGTQIANNLTYLIEPTNLSLLNNTVYNFALTTNSSQAITFTSLNITNASGYQLGYASTAGQGRISVSVNTQNYTSIYGYALIQTSNESFSVTKVWTVQNDFVGDYSIYRQALLFSTYQFSPTIRLLLVLIILVGITIYVSQVEYIDNTDAKIGIIITMVWILSFFGWLDIGLTINGATQAGRLALLGSKYGIAILTTAAGAAISLRRIYT